MWIAVRCLRTLCMVQMATIPYVSVRSMSTLFQQALSGKKDVDRHMINNVRTRTRRRKLELDSKRIRIDTKHFDSSFIKTCVSNTDNYTEGK